jgi:hypothetical protein
MNSIVRAVALASNGDVFAAGAFTMAGGVAANRVARWNGVAWSPLGAGCNGLVEASQVLPTGDLVVAGLFTTAGGVTANRLARWDGVAWSAIGGGADAEVRAVAVLPNGSVAIGGEFTIVDGATNAYFARYDSICPATATTTGSGCVGSGGANVLSATSLPWIGSNVQTLATGMPSLGIAMRLIGFAQTSIPMSAILPQGVPGCSLLVTPDFLDLHVPTAGSLTTTFTLPNSLALVGAVLHQQIAPLEFDLAGNLTALTASNALALTIGAL